MPIKKISSDPDMKRVEPCRHPDHNVPSHIYLTPGTYEHTCPGCGKRTVFTDGVMHAQGARGGDALA